jgi:hypothetical protein
VNALKSLINHSIIPEQLMQMKIPILTDIQSGSKTVNDEISIESKYANNFLHGALQSAH